MAEDLTKINSAEDLVAAVVVVSMTSEDSEDLIFQISAEAAVAVEVLAVN
jgi:hypothetical protein